MRTYNSIELSQILGDLLLASIDADIQLSCISTDTRNINAGDVFAAISGQQFDGHDFVELAFEKGAAAVIVEREQTVSLPQIIVKDTRLALGKLAARIRDEFVENNGKVVGITGSVGKTTNKQMLAAILSQVGKTHATKGNLNNDLGVPFTWFDLPDDAGFSVIEMGANHQGEIAYLSSITRPQVAMITNAGESHLEGFGGLDGVAKGKGELFSGLLAGSTAVINKDDVYSDYWLGLVPEHSSTWTFSLVDAEADVYASEISSDGSSFVLCHADDRIAVTLPIVGRHNVMNALGCAACALALGVSLSDIALGLSQFETAKGRLQKHQLDKLTIIDDSYNANPTSVRASADIIVAASGYCIMVLGDMGELGEEELALHHQLGRDIADKADSFFCLGERMTAFADANKKAKHYTDKNSLLVALVDQIAEVKKQQNVTVLVKGSRSMKMESIVEHLLEKF